MSDAHDERGERASAAEPPASVTRRTVVGATVGLFGAGYTGAIGYPIYCYLNTPVARAEEAAKVTQVSPAGGRQLPPGAGMGFMFGTRPAVLIHHPDGTWSAFDAICTHLGCTVKYEPDKDRIFCACHLGTYNARTGEPTSGPPPRALTQYHVEVKDDEVIVSRS